METVTQTEYNPHTLITLKQLINPESGDVQYQMYKTTELETVLHDAKTRTNSLEKQLTISNGQISQILGYLDANGWYNPNTDKQDILSTLCEILEHEPKQTVRITGTISFEVDYDIPMEDVEDFDAHYFLQDTLTLDAYNGDVIVESWTVEDSDVDWN